MSEPQSQLETSTAQQPKKRTGASSPDNSSTQTESLLVEHPSPTSSSKDGFLPISKGSDTTTGTTTTTDAMGLTQTRKSSLDRFLQGYNAFMSSGINQDRGIKLLQYTLWMVSYASKRRPVLRDACKKLYNELSFARYVLRFLGLVPALEAAKNGSWAVTTLPTASSWQKRLQSWLGKILAWSMVGYYPLEYGAYLGWQTPQLLSPNTTASRLAEKLSAYSCRCWLAYIWAEMFQCYLKLREEQQLIKAEANYKKTDSDNPDSVDEGETAMVDGKVARPNAAAMNHLKLQMLRGALFTLPAIHWSLPNWDRDPWLPDVVVNGCMWAEAIVCMYQSIYNFQT